MASRMKVVFIWEGTLRGSTDSQAVSVEQIEGSVRDEN